MGMNNSRISQTLMPRILFVSHEASLTGAPLSLLNIIKAVSKLHLFDIKILIRSEGVLEKEFRSLAPTDIYYKKIVKKTLKDKVFYNLFRGKRVRQIENRLFKRWRPNLVYVNTVANGDIVEIANRYDIPVIIHVQELTSEIEKIGVKNI